MRIAVVGGGAAGFFGAIAAAAANPAARIDLFEAARHPLQKVRISGGGRCNVTHHCFEPRELVQGYPRGAKELLGPFTRFGPTETVEWFALRGVHLKTEGDGRMFPVTDRSATVVDCLLGTAMDAGVHLRLGENLKAISRSPGDAAGFELTFTDGSTSTHDSVLMATGGNPAGYRLAADLGHTIVPCVPSLFTFNVARDGRNQETDPRLRELSGISFENVELTLADDGSRRLTQEGPLLITHWGLSGPAVLKLSAWGARVLADRGYRAFLTVNFVPDLDRDRVLRDLVAFRTANGSKRVRTQRLFSIPSRYWARLVDHAGVADDAVWSQLSSKVLGAFVNELTAARFVITGKGVFKDEFVTCGGVKLSEVDFRTMQSRLVPGLYFAGEILDVDGITGGFNFQSAWTTGWVAGSSMR